MSLPVLALRSDPKAKLSKNKSIDGNTTAYEQKVLASLIRKHKPKKMLEIGTFNGLSTLHMAINTPPSSQITTVDIEGKHLDYLKLPIQGNRYTYNDARYIKKPSIGQLFRGTPAARKITQVLCDSALLERKVKQRFDFIFIDGSHSYEYTSSDSRFALQHLNEGGVILWHDYGKRSWPGVTKALDELYEQGAEIQRVANTSFVLLCTRRGYAALRQSK